jgi:two-component system LytT family response regulator
VTYRAMIVDDEKLARQRLQKMLTVHSDTIRVVAEAENGNRALELLKSHPIDVIFLDIQMPGMSGFELLEKLDDPPYIIFSTAFDQYALQAFDTNSLDYLLKPIEKDRLARSIGKLEKAMKSDQNDFQEKLDAVLNAMVQPKIRKFPVKAGDKTFLIDYASILYFLAEDKYVKLQTIDTSYYLSDTLNNIAAKVPGDTFVRAHRSVVVNVDAIKEIHKWFAGKYRIVMNDKERTTLPLSRNMRHLISL